MTIPKILKIVVLSFSWKEKDILLIPLIFVQEVFNQAKHLTLEIVQSDQIKERNKSLVLMSLCKELYGHMHYVQGAHL